MEKRQATRLFEIRAAQGEEFVLAGRALSYNEISSNELARGLREKIMPGCFRAFLASGQPTFCTLNHSNQAGVLPLGRTDNGTLTIADTPTALNMRCQLDRNNSQHRDVYASVKRGDIREMSFCFVPEDEDIVDDFYQGQACMVRRVKQATLEDVSVVSMAFYGKNATAVAARIAGEKGDEAKRSRCEAIGKQILADRLAQAAKAVEEDRARKFIDSSPGIFH